MIHTAHPNQPEARANRRRHPLVSGVVMGRVPPGTRVAAMKPAPESRFVPRRRIQKCDHGSWERVWRHLQSPAAVIAMTARSLGPCQHPRRWRAGGPISPRPCCSTPDRAATALPISPLEAIGPRPTRFTLQARLFSSVNDSSTSKDADSMTRTTPTAGSTRTGRGPAIDRISFPIPFRVAEPRPLWAVGSSFLGAS